MRKFDSALKSCYESHKALKYGKYALYGGSASYPVVKDADIYVSLQWGSTCSRTSDPWDEQKVVEVQFEIVDTQAPSNISRFKKMITWLCEQLKAGKKIHVGCIGGHGRTGTVLAAMVAELGEHDAIAYVRKHYCHKAVETKKQVDFLVKHYGVAKAEPGKLPLLFKGNHFAANDFYLSQWDASYYSPKAKGVPKGDSLITHRIFEEEDDTPSSASKVYMPMPSSRCIWKERGDN